jgi:flagellar basal-body rod protein FlgB
LIHGLFHHGAMPSVERLVQFTGQRHQVLTHNIANLSTPHFRPRDLDPAAFQKELGRAIDQRRQQASPVDGPLELRDTRQLKFHDDRIEATPTQTDRNVLFHDRNNRDLERIMQDLAENTLAHNTGIELLRSEFSLLETAIRERV